MESGRCETTRFVRPVSNDTLLWEGSYLFENPYPPKARGHAFESCRARHNFTAIQRIVSSKYHRGAAFNRQHPFVEILFSDITESGETLDLSELVREPLPPAFHRQRP